MFKSLASFFVIVVLLVDCKSKTEPMDGTISDPGNLFFGSLITKSTWKVVGGDVDDSMQYFHA